MRALRRAFLLALLRPSAPHGDTLGHSHFSGCACGVRQIFPHGGPFTGNTAVTITGRAFQDLGDVKCRFGIDEVQARVVNETLVECSSPGCTSPTCLPGQEYTELAVPLEVSMNGVTFTGSGLQYTYYDMRVVAVSLLTPSGGPRLGGTQLTVHGAGFRDFSSGVSGVLQQGLKCKFGANDMVSATRTGGSGRHEARCTAPVDATLAAEWDSDAPAHATRALELTFNGYDTNGTITESNVPYTYYHPAAFNVSRVFPLGGPLGGGTLVSVYLTDDRLLVDLGGGQRGLYCAFSYEEEVGELGHKVVETKTIRVDAELADCGGARACGAGWGSITCQAPPIPLHEITRDGDARDVRVDVTVNGQNYTDGGVLYRYYDDTAWRIHGFHPRGGPLGGNTSLAVTGMRLQPLGDVRCRYGVLNPQVNATVVASTSIACVSPPHWRWRGVTEDGAKRAAGEGGQDAAVQLVDLEITLNGQDYLPYLPHTSTYSYYSLDAFPSGVAVLGARPNGGPSGGGTLVDVTGVGFVDRGNILCHFGASPEAGASDDDPWDPMTVRATWVTSEHIRCLSPPATLADADGAPFEARALEVTVNSQLRALTAGAVPFTYVAPAAVTVSRVYPRGGPRGGGTTVTVWGAGFRDLDRGDGLKCKFGDSGLIVAALDGVDDPGGAWPDGGQGAADAGGAGPQTLTCVAPPLPPSEACQTVQVRVTNNAHNPPGEEDDGGSITDDDVGYTYFDSERAADVGASTPGGASLRDDPPYWTGDDTLR